MAVSRCFKPEEFTDVKEISLHHFSDASDEGYGQCSYIRLVNGDGKIHCSFVMGKSRVIPSKPKLNIPRLELIAAVLSARIGESINVNLDYVQST